MTSLRESMRLAVPVREARAYLRWYVQARADAQGRIRFALHSTTSALGIPGGVDLERDVLARVVANAEGYALSWEPEGGGPFPRFVGRIAIVGDEATHESTIALSGAYEPPGGSIGALFDRVTGQRIADAALVDFLRSAKAAIEAEHERRHRHYTR